MSIVEGLVDLGPLRSSPAFRRLWIGTGLSVLGGQLSVVAVLYQVWQLTHSVLWVGLTGLVQAVPMVFFGVAGGSVADAVDRRRLVLLTTSAQLVTASLLAVQAFAGSRSVWLLWALVAAEFSAGALGAPARRTFVSRLLPEHQVGAGIALTHLSFQVAMLAGPALGGLVIGGWGLGWCYLLDAVSFAAALHGVRGLPAMRPLGPRVDSPGLSTTLAGWRFIAGQPVLGGALLTDLLATVTAMPIATFPVINQQRFGGAPQTLGLFLSAIAVGGIAAGAGSGAVTRLTRQGVVMLAAAGVWGAGLAGAGLAGGLWPLLGCLALAGAADMLSVISRGAIVQLATPDSHRGRVSAVEHVIGVSSPDLGNVRAGLVAGATSASFALVSGGLMCVAGIVAVAVADPAVRRFRTATPARARRDDPAAVVVPPSAPGA